jgi:hypothetical protein
VAAQRALGGQACKPHGSARLPERAFRPAHGPLSTPTPSPRAPARPPAAALSARAAPRAAARAAAARRSAMAAAVEHLQHELAGVRTGRANPGLLESIPVEAHGERLPLKACGTVTVRTPQLLAVAVFDPEVGGGARARRRRRRRRRAGARAGGRRRRAALGAPAAGAGARGRGAPSCGGPRPPLRRLCSRRPRAPGARGRPRRGPRPYAPCCRPPSPAQLVAAVVKAIQNSPLSLSPAHEGGEVLVKLPRMTKDTVEQARGRGAGATRGRPWRGQGPRAEGRAAAGRCAAGRRAGEAAL